MSEQYVLDTVRMRRTIQELGTQLEAWHLAFGTKQLGHAVERLEAAERKALLLEAQLQGKTTVPVGGVDQDPHETVVGPAPTHRWTFPNLPPPDTHPHPRRIDIGWQCPVCRRVNSPYVTECRCSMMTAGKAGA